MSDSPQPAEFGDDFSRVLCVVAHPDDIEYGTAAAVHRWAGRGQDGHLLPADPRRGGHRHDGTPTRPARVREEEERDGAALGSGVDEVDFGDHRDGAIEYGVACAATSPARSAGAGPSVVVARDCGERFVGGMVNQADHRAVGLAALDAVADAGNRWLHTELADEGLEPWGGVKAAAASRAAPQPDALRGRVRRALRGVGASLEAHEAYNAALPPDFPAPRELLGMILGGGGQAAGVEHARCSTSSSRG